MAGQWLVFWCTVAGLVVVVLSALRHDDKPGLGHTERHRIREEMRHHDNDQGRSS